MILAARLLPIVASLMLAACYNPPESSGGRARANAGTVAACGRRADDVYLRQNRDEIYRADNYVGNTRDSPFSGTGLSGITSAGLSGRYARDNIQAACLNSANSPGGDSSDPAAALAPSNGPSSASRPPAKASPVTR